MSLYTPAQLTALGDYLSEWPETLTYDEVIQALIDGDDVVSVWEPFEHHSREDVAEFIENLHSACMNNFKPLYDALNVFVNDFDQTRSLFSGKCLQIANSTYDKAKNALTIGKGK